MVMNMKELRELMERVKLKVRRLKFFAKEGRIVDAINVMGIELGRQDKISTYPYENDLEIRFFSLPDFFKQVVSIDGIGIEADISLGDFGYSKQYFYHALKIVKDPEIGIPNMQYPLIIRNNMCSVFIAPKIDPEKIDIRTLIDINVDDPSLVEELSFFTKGDLIAIPDSIKQFKNLKKLNLAFNPLTQLNDALKEITGLEELYLAGTHLDTLPEWIGELKKLKILDLALTKLNVLPESTKNLSSLEILNLECVELVNINDIPELLNEDKLRTLNLCQTGFTNLLGLQRFKNLEVLGIAGNKIDDIKDLKYLKNLKELNISGNKYSKIEGLEDLVNLEYLDIDLYVIEGLHNLTNLERLIINYLEKDKVLLDKLGGIWDMEHVDEVNEPQNIVEYCRKKKFTRDEFEEDLTLGGLSEISVIVLEERANKGDKIAEELLNLNNKIKK